MFKSPPQKIFRRCFHPLNHLFHCPLNHPQNRYLKQCGTPKMGPNIHIHLGEGTRMDRQGIRTGMTPEKNHPTGGVLHSRIPFRFIPNTRTWSFPTQHQQEKWKSQNGDRRLRPKEDSCLFEAPRLLRLKMQLLGTGTTQIVFRGTLFRGGLTDNGKPPSVFAGGDLNTFRPERC